LPDLHHSPDYDNNPVVEYRLAGPEIFDLCKALRIVAENRHAELESLVRDHFGDRSDPEPVGMEELMEPVEIGSADQREDKRNLILF
jgi:hypothetical protein